MRRPIRPLRLDRRRLTRSWRRSGGLWGGGWSLCCRGHGWFRLRPHFLPPLLPFRKVRGRMGHPHCRLLPRCDGDGRGRPSLHRPEIVDELQAAAANARTASRRLSSRLIRSTRIRTRRGRSSNRTLWRSWPPRSRRREYCSRSWFGQRHFRRPVWVNNRWIRNRSIRNGWVSPATSRSRASGRKAALHPDPGRAAFSRVEDGGEDDDPGDRETGLGAAGGGDDAGREPAAPGPPLPGAGGGLRQAEHGLPPDAGRDWETCGRVARAGIELSALAETAAAKCSTRCGTKT